MVLFVAILSVSGALAFLLLSLPKTTVSADGTSSQNAAVFGVKSVVIEGDTRYSQEAIIGVSGIRIGQSIFSVNKRLANENIMKYFPYIETVDVGNVDFDTIRITVTEVEPIGAMYANGQWLVVGTNGKAVEALPIEGDCPSRYIYFKGATSLTGVVGEAAMDDRSFKIVTSLLDAFEAYGLTDINEIDISDKTNIQLSWKNQITIAMGNETNLYHQVGAAAAALPKILASNGSTVTGLMNLSSYSDSNTSNDAVVFKPASVLANTATTTTG